MHCGNYTIKNLPQFVFWEGRYTIIPRRINSLILKHTTIVFPHKNIWCETRENKQEKLHYSNATKEKGYSKALLYFTLYI